MLSAIDVTFAVADVLPGGVIRATWLSRGQQVPVEAALELSADVGLDALDPEGQLLEHMSMNCSCTPTEWVGGPRTFTAHERQEAT